jgi:lambda family phage tail tape measure protein
MASNIRVVLEVDNKKYIADIKSADTTTQAFGRNATKSIDSIGLVSNNVVAKLGGLKTAIAGLISATALQQANAFANAIKDISTTSDVSIEGVLGLSRAFELNGGTAEGAQAAVLKFADSIAQARDGNNSALKSFREIGITVDDLNKNGIEELTKKSIAGISGLSSATAKIRTQTDLFGKSARGVSFSGVQQTQSSQFISPETVAALKSGADASENMRRQFSNLTEALLRVAQPLNDIVKSVNITATAFQSLITAIIAGIGAYLLFGRGVAVVTGAVNAGLTGIKATGGVIAVLTSPIKAVVKDLGSFVNMWTRVITGASSAASGIGALGGSIAILSRVLLRLGGFISVFIALAEAVNFFSKQFFKFDIIDSVTTKIGKLYEATKKLRGIQSEQPAGAGAGRGGNAETLRLQQEQGDKMKKAWDEQQEALKATRERYAKLRNEVSRVGDESQRNNILQLQHLTLAKEMVTMSEDQRERVQALEDMYDKTKQTIQGLVDKRKEWSQGTEDQRANVGAIDAEIARIKKLETTQATQMVKYIDELQGARMIEKARLQDIENMTKAMEAQQRVQEALSNVRISIRGQQQDTAFAGGQIGKGELQKQMADIAETNRRAGLEASRAFAQAFEDDGDGLTAEQSQQLADGLNAIAEGYKTITDAQIANLELSRSWSAGWDEAFANYKTAAQNSAEQAKTYFTTFTSGVEDAIVSFVRTGKLSFKDLANSLIAEFAKSQVKNIFSSLLGMGGSGGSNLFGSIAGFFGFGGGKAAGGGVMGGKSYMVGERGPEMFTPGRSGTITPNQAFGGTSNTVVTYNIQAVDAASFKSLVASDPEFIFGVSERGRRNLPLRSRL